MVTPGDIDPQVKDDPWVGSVTVHTPTGTRAGAGATDSGPVSSRATVSTVGIRSGQRSTIGMFDVAEPQAAHDAPNPPTKVGLDSLATGVGPGVCQ